MADPTSKEAAKPVRRGAGKASRDLKVPAASKVKSTIHLTREASQRLDIHCSMMDVDRSAMVEKLINDHLRRFVVSDRGGPSGVVAEAG